MKRICQEVRRPLEEEEFQWSSLYSLSQHAVLRRARKPSTSTCQVALHLASGCTVLYCPRCGFTATVQFNVEGWAVGSFTGAAAWLYRGGHVAKVREGQRTRPFLLRRSVGRKRRSRTQQGWHFFIYRKRKLGAHRPASPAHTLYRSTDAGPDVSRSSRRCRRPCACRRTSPSLPCWSSWCCKELWREQSRRLCLLSPAVLAEAVFAGDFGEADL